MQSSESVQTVERPQYHAVVDIQTFLFLQMVVVADEQHTVSGRNTEQRDKADDSRNAHLSRGDNQCKYAANQCKRQVQQDNAGFLHVTEFMVKQQEDNDNTDK